MAQRSMPESAGSLSPRPPATLRGTLETGVICGAFALYAVFALKLLLLSRAPGSERSFNLIPFASIGQYLFGSSSGVKTFAFANVAGNVLLFIPLGAELPVLAKWTAARTMLVVASVSVTVEILQGVFAVGASDLDDVILNCLGGFVGVQLIRVLTAIVGGRGQVRTLVAVVSVVAIPAIGLLLFVVRLRL